jgi:hypothetical protein
VKTFLWAVAFCGAYGSLLCIWLPRPGSAGSGGGTNEGEA